MCDKISLVINTLWNVLILSRSIVIYHFQGLDYRWVQTGNLKTESPVRALSWNLEGTRLLTAGAQVQLWHLKSQPLEEERPKSTVTFTLGGGHVDGGDDGDMHDEPDKPQGWLAGYAVAYG